jgi:hypothetical protein
MDNQKRPPALSSSEFDALMVRLYPEIAATLAAVSRPKAAMLVVHHLWINNVEPSEDLTLFRAHMQHLEQQGWFDFNDSHEKTSALP